MSQSSRVTRNQSTPANAGGDSFFRVVDSHLRTHQLMIPPAVESAESDSTQDRVAWIGSRPTTRAARNQVAATPPATLDLPCLDWLSATLTDSSSALHRRAGPAIQPLQFLIAVEQNLSCASLNWFSTSCLPLFQTLLQTCSM